LPLRSLSLTTNGFLLKSLAGPLAEAGLKRINVSLDTLQHDRFHQIARRRGLDEVLGGLEELERYPSISPIKVNVVAMRDFTEDEVVAFAQLARRTPYVIRLTADGQIRTCLFSVDEWDLRRPLRTGASDAEIADILIEAVGHKELKHKINEGEAFQRASRSMSQIGG